MANESLLDLRAVDKSACPVSPSDDSPSETTNLELINHVWAGTHGTANALGALADLFEEHSDADFDSGIASILRGLSKQLWSCNEDACILNHRFGGSPS